VETTSTAPLPSAPAEDSALLRDFLAQRDIACPVCSYNLRGLSRPVCPECSAPLHLRVGSDNLRLGPWLLAVIALALALGFDGVVAVLLGAAGLIFEPPKSPAEFQIFLAMFGCFVGLAAGVGTGIWLLVRFRPRWNRLPSRRQWTLGLLIFFGTGFGHVLFGWIITRYLH
jgi:hypothetical protein